MPSPWRRRARWIAMQAARAVLPVVTTRVGPDRLTYDVRDHYIGPELFLRRAWEPHLIALLDSWELAGKVAIEAGACIGTHTLPLSRCVGSAGRVIALEPDPRQFALLERNVARSGAGNVQLLQAAASDVAGTTGLARTAHNFGGARIAAGSGLQRVRTVTLDAIADELPAASVGFVKIDVEGHELQVLRGMREILRRNPRLVLQLELSPETAAGTSHPAGVLELLASHGLGGFEIWKQRFLPMQQSCWYESAALREPVNLLLTVDVPWMHERLEAAARAGVFGSGAA
jgi:FkbM family methyltransferase